MEILLDTANVADIRKYHAYYDITGVTTNPTILSREKAGFFDLMTEIRGIIGTKDLHVQVTAETSEEMLKEAEAIVKRIGKEGLYIKVPVNEEGLKTIKALHREGIGTTGTAVYSVQQAMLAASVGADYVAPYFNRMQDINIDSASAISDMICLFTDSHLPTKVVAASFKNVGQIMEALLAGAHAVTADPALYTKMVESPVIEGAINGFRKDWIRTYGDKKIYEL